MLHNLEATKLIKLIIKKAKDIDEKILTMLNSILNTHILILRSQ